MDRKSILAIALCSLCYFGYEYYLNQKYPTRFAKPATQTEVPVSATSSASPLSAVSPTLRGEPASASASMPPATASAETQLSAEELTVENATSRYTFVQQTGGLQQVLLKNYQDEMRKGPLLLLESEFLLQPTLPGETKLYTGFAARRVSPSSIIFTRSTPE